MKTNQRITLSFDSATADQIRNYAWPSRPASFVRQCAVAILQMMVDEPGARTVPFIVSTRGGISTHLAPGGPAKYCVSFNEAEMTRLRACAEVSQRTLSKMVRLCVKAILEMGTQLPGTETVPSIVRSYDLAMEYRRSDPPSKVCYADFRRVATQAPDNPPVSPGTLVAGVSGGRVKSRAPSRDAKESRASWLLHGRMSALIRGIIPPDDIEKHPWDE